MGSSPTKPTIPKEWSNMMKLNDKLIGHSI